MERGCARAAEKQNNISGLSASVATTSRFAKRTLLDVTQTKPTPVIRGSSQSLSFSVNVRRRAIR
jgi:hypothetical protein